MAKLRRISFCFIFILIELYYLVYAQQIVDPADPKAICQALGNQDDTNAVCKNNTGSTQYAHPGNCKEYFFCIGEKRFTSNCRGSLLYDVTVGSCQELSTNPYCYEPCDSYQEQQSNSSTFLPPPYDTTQDVASTSENIDEIFERDMVFTTINPKQTSKVISLDINTTGTITTQSTVTPGSNIPPTTSKQCRLLIPCIPGHNIGDKDDCTKYYTCNETGLSWSEKYCRWFGTQYDTVQKICTINGHCQTECPFLDALGTTAASSDLANIITTEQTSINYNYSNTITATPKIYSQTTAHILTSTNINHITTMNVSSTLNLSPTPTVDVSNTTVPPSEGTTNKYTTEYKSCFYPIPCTPGQNVGNRENCSTYLHCNANGSQWVEKHCQWRYTYYDSLTNTCVINKHPAICQDGCPFADSIVLSSTASTSIGLQNNSVLNGLFPDVLISKTFQTWTASEVQNKYLTTDTEEPTNDSTMLLNNVTESLLLLNTSSTVTTAATDTTVDGDILNDVYETTYTPSTSNITTNIYPYNLNKNVSLGITNDSDLFGDITSDRNGDSFVFTKDYTHIYSSTNIPISHANVNITNLPDIVGTLPATNGQVDTVTPSSTIQPCTLKLPCNATTLVGDKDDCSKYFECNQDGTDWISKPCRWNGAQFDVVKGICALTAQCQQGCPFPDTVISITTASSPEPLSTNQEITTVNSSIISLSNKTGLVNLETTTSIFTKDYTHMYSSTNSNIPILHDNKSITNFPGIVGTEAATNGQVDIVTPSANAQPCIFKLPCIPQTLVGDQDDCSKYFSCNSDGAGWSLKNCAWSGSQFDVVKGTCALTAQCQQGCPFPNTVISITTDSTTNPASNIGSTGTMVDVNASSTFAFVQTTGSGTDEQTMTDKITESTSEPNTSGQTTHLPQISEIGTIANYKTTTDTLSTVVPVTISSTLGELSTTGNVHDQTTLVLDQTTKVTTIPSVETTSVNIKASTQTPQGTTTAEFQSTTLKDETTTTAKQVIITTTQESTELPNRTTATVGQTNAMTEQVKTENPTSTVTTETTTENPTTDSPTTVLTMTTTQSEATTSKPFITDLPLTSTESGSGTTSGDFDTTTNLVLNLDPCNQTSDCFNEGAIIADPKNCNKYYLCRVVSKQTKLKWDKQTCHGQDRLFDKITMACADAQNTTCQERCSADTPPPTLVVPPTFKPTPQAQTTTISAQTTDGSTTKQVVIAQTTINSSETEAIPTTVPVLITQTTIISPQTTEGSTTKPIVIAQTTINSSETEAISTTVPVLITQTTIISPQTTEGSTTKPVVIAQTTINSSETEAVSTTVPVLITQTTISSSETKGPTTKPVIIGTTKPPSGVISSHSVLIKSSGAAVEGGSFSLLCSFIITPNTVDSSVMWYLDDMLLRNSNRITITRTMTMQQSTLTFTSLRASDKGTISCVVKLLNSDIESSRFMPLQVIPKPVVEIDTLSLTIREGAIINLGCTAVNGTNTNTLLWYRNGEQLVSADPENITMDGLSSKLTLIAQIQTQNDKYSCAGRNEAGIGQKESVLVVVIQEKEPVCNFEHRGGINWTLTILGGVNIQPCPNNMIGQAIRECLETDKGGDTMVISDAKHATWGVPNLNHCVDKQFMDLLETVERIEEGIGGDTEELIQITQTLEAVTNVSTVLPPGNLNTAVDTIAILGQFHESYVYELPEIKTMLSQEELDSVVNTISNLLQDMNVESWDSVQKENPSKSVSLLNTVDTYRDTAALQLQPEELLSVSSEYLVLQAECFTKKNVRQVMYPKMIPNLQWMDTTVDTIVLEKETLASVSDGLPGENIVTSSSYYRNIEKLLPNYNSNSNNTDDAFINSKVLAVSVNSLKSATILQPPIQLTFTQDEQIMVLNETANCTFWNFRKGIWSTEGCEVIYSNSTSITCQCNHLTNFAVLVSRKPVTGYHAYILGIITIVGCVISIGGMVLTILIYITIWKHVKSHHAVVLLNLCVCLIIANLIFVTGVDKTEPKEICIAIAVLLHYFYLAAFCLMLVEGIQLILYIIYVFHVRRKRETAGLIVLGWVVPAVIVAICLGINKTEGYGNENYCWLDPNSWLFWSFIVPVGIILIINTIILICVLKRISTSKIHQIDKNRHQKIRSSMWNIVVVMPILGITWFFGVFSVNSDILAFQYIFAVSNSLQGLFIFIFHALCNKKAISSRKSSSGSTLKGRYHVKSSTKTQRSRLKSDSSGKNSNKSTKSSKSSKSSKDKKKNSLSVSAECPGYDTIPADFMDFNESAYKPTPQPQTPEDITFNNVNSNGKFVIENDYMMPYSIPSTADKNTAEVESRREEQGAYNNLTFNTFGAGGNFSHDYNQVGITFNSPHNTSEDDTNTSLYKHMNFFERLNSVNEMRSEEFMDIKLAADKVRFRDSPRQSPRSSPYLPRSTPFLARHTEPGPESVKAQTSFNY